MKPQNDYSSEMEKFLVQNSFMQKYHANQLESKNNGSGTQESELEEMKRIIKINQLNEFIKAQVSEST